MQQHNPLDEVATLAEVCRVWEKHRTSVIWQYWNGYLKMKKSGGTWLVELESMRSIYGHEVPEKSIREFD